MTDASSTIFQSNWAAAGRLHFDAELKGRRFRRESTYRKSTAITAVQSPDMPGSDDPGKVTGLPRMIEAIVRIVATRIVPDPTIIFRVYMRR